MWIAKNEDGKWHAFKHEPSLAFGTWIAKGTMLQIDRYIKIECKDSLKRVGDGMWKACDRCGEVFVYGTCPVADIDSGNWETRVGDLYPVTGANLNRWDSSLERM